MEDREYSLFLTIAGMAVFAYALSAIGRRWQREFSVKSLGWLSALERTTMAGRWILIALGFLIIFVMRSQRHHDPRLVLIVVGILGGIGNMFWEMNG
jgi:hypothetical protein